mmetsp:Transcript_12597/g.30995  ORF Transcript_12597/g.30995 Transcript_12597/m.30995 type:complete len:350 (-) Transcript_12597:282-1331(-)
MFKDANFKSPVVDPWRYIKYMSSSSSSDILSLSCWAALRPKAVSNAELASSSFRSLRRNNPLRKWATGLRGVSSQASAAALLPAMYLFVKKAEVAILKSTRDSLCKSRPLQIASACFASSFLPEGLRSTSRHAVKQRSDASTEPAALYTRLSSSQTNGSPGTHLIASLYSPIAASRPELSELPSLCCAPPPDNRCVRARSQRTMALMALVSRRAKPLPSADAASSSPLSSRAAPLASPERSRHRQPKHRSFQRSQASLAGTPVVWRRYRAALRRRSSVPMRRALRATENPTAPQDPSSVGSSLTAVQAAWDAKGSPRSTIARALSCLRLTTASRARSAFGASSRTGLLS